MTDPNQTQPPQQPDQQGTAPVHPPQQYQPPAGGYLPPPVDQPPPAAPAGRSRKLLITGIVSLVAVLAVVTAGVAVYDTFIREDFGVAVCKAMRDGKDILGNEERGGDDEMTEAEYREARELFEDSRHEDIREHGTALMDIAWQVSNLPEDQGMGALAFLGAMGTHISGLQTACADQGVIVNLNRD
ncbi:hypothetical protein ABZ814_02390 [Micromonospora musae]|uniref:hypothetical protein n=1 Tax=Micromonospora musae TaxID=1894970 RepID=UPI0033F8AA02